jgi:SAM-dependent methyltransferase
MNREDIVSRIRKIQWFHDFELVPGVMTNGWSSMSERVSYFQIPQDLTGKRVLDIGCADGYFSFLAESRGASVVSIDSWPREGYSLAHEVLNSKAEFHHMSVYDLCPDTFGLFDIVFFFGVYYHLKNPILALERIASVTRGYALIESEIVDIQYTNGEGVSHFCEFDERNNDSTNWWVPNIPCLLQTARASGFPRVELVNRYGNTRVIVRAHKGPRTAGRPLTENIFITIDAPSVSSQVQGTIPISGWALHQFEPQDGIEQIFIYLDNLDDPASELGKAEYGIQRMDLVPYVNPIYGSVGFQFVWDTTGVTPGEHVLYILVEGKESWNYSRVPIFVGAPEMNQKSLQAFDAPVEREQMSSRGDTIAELNQAISERESEIARLRELVAGYEQGRFIRLTRWFDKTWQSLLKSRYVVLWLDQIRIERFYRQLIREVGQASSHAFVDRAYWRVLGRAPDVSGFMYYTDLLAQGRCSRRRIVAHLVQSTEFRTLPRPTYDLLEMLHLARCELISQLPPADHVLDLGGAAPNSVQGALFVMGYPHRVRSLTIVDLPPGDRLGNYECGDSEKPGCWIDTEMGSIRHVYASMTDLSVIESGSVDLVFSGQSIEQVSEEDGQRVMQEAFRVLRPGGHFCLDTPNGVLTRIQSPDAFLHPEHKVEYRVDDLAARLQDVGFEIQEIKGIGPMPHTVQTGIFDEQELLTNAYLSDDADICYLFYIRCVKPD